VPRDRARVATAQLCGVQSRLPRSMTPWPNAFMLVRDALTLARNWLAALGPHDEKNLAGRRTR